MNLNPRYNHDQRIANAVAKIDNKPPRFNAPAYYKPRTLEIDAARTREIDMENMELLKRLNAISRVNGNIDCWMPSIIRRSHAKDREVDNIDIIKANKMLLKRLQNVVSEYSAAEFLKAWNDMKKRRGSSHEKLTFTPIVKKGYGITKNLPPDIHVDPAIRTRCFFDIVVQETKQNLGKIVIQLFDDIVPQTCANFLKLCQGTNGFSYKNTPFHRIVSSYWCQGGDVTNFNGTGGDSVHEDMTENENFYLSHSGPGILSMYSSDNPSDSKFNITFKCLKTMDGKKVVFGQVVSGLSNFYKIEEFGTKTGKPIKTIIISNCGAIKTKQA